MSHPAMVLRSTIKGRLMDRITSHRRHGLRAGTALLLATLAAGSALAQSAEATDAAPGDIVVTARKRSESLVNVPEAITAFGTEQIQRAGMQSLRDFTNLTPNITVTAGAGSAYPNIMVRGLAQALNGEAPIAVVIDGVQVSHPAFISQDYGDVAQVEVLRGPQGSLYGRNAIGGAINITTRQPTNDFEGRVKASYGNGHTITANADLSGPIVADKILFRLGGSYRDTDGFIRNQTTGELVDSGHSMFLRGRLIFNLTDALTLDLRANYGRDRNGILLTELISTAQFDDFKPGFLFGDPPVRERRDLYDVSAKLEYAADAFTVTSITGYSHVKNNAFGDADFAPVHVVLQDVTLRVKALTEELRITSSADRPFRWLVGAFYQDRDNDNFVNVPFDDGTGRPIPGSFASQSQDVGTSKSWAAFGSASYDITPQLEFTLGARYDKDKRTSVDQLIPASATDGTFSAFQPKIQLVYKPSRTFSLYATYGEGFSSGGFNAFGAAAAVGRRYGAETAENYEVGMKGALLDGKLDFATSLFRVYYRNQQFFFNVFSPPSQNIINIDKTRVEGLEAEVTLRPVTRLSLSAGLGYTDSKILRMVAEPTSVGNRTPQNTRYTVNLTGQYSLPLTDDFDLVAYASYRRQGTEYWDAANTLRTPPKDFVNLRLSVEGGGWTLGGFVNNLTNTQYPAQASANAAGPGVHLRIPSARRTYGVEASYRF
jgi:iron complex outermembrane receptor protein